MELLQCTASRPGGSGQQNSCDALPHHLGAVGRATAAKSYSNAAGSATPPINCLTAYGQWAVEHLQCTVTLLGRGSQWNSCTALPRCVGAVGTGMHCLGGTGRCTSFNALPHCLGAVDSATPSMQCHTPWGQCAVELLLCTATLLGGNGPWNASNVVPLCLMAVGNGTPSKHRFTT